ATVARAARPVRHALKEAPYPNAARSRAAFFGRNAPASLRPETRPTRRSPETARPRFAPPAAGWTGRTALLRQRWHARFRQLPATARRSLRVNPGKPIERHARLD